MGARYSYDEVEFESTVTDNTLLSAAICATPVEEGGFGLDLETCNFLEASGAPFFGTAFGTWLDDGSLVIDALDESETDSSLDGKIAIDYTPNDDWLIYGSVSTGYRGGRFFASAVQSTGYLFYVKPEELPAYEIGFKGTMADGRFQLNGAAYYYDYEERQSLVLASAASALANVPGSEMTGAELEARWVPAEGWDIVLGAAYIDSEVTDPLTTLPSGIPVDGAEDFEGSVLPRAPEWSYNARVSYVRGFGNNLQFRGLVSYDWTDVQESQLAPLATMDEHENLTARVGIGSQDERWELAIWGKNLTDNENQFNVFEAFSLNQYIGALAPRTYGVEFKTRF